MRVRSACASPNPVPEKLRSAPIAGVLTGVTSVALWAKLSAQGRATVAVLVYHEVSTRRPSSGFSRYSITPDRLEEHLATLVSGGFRLRSISDLSVSDDEPQVAVTFDDGYASFCDSALPILNRFKARSTLYVPTAYVGMRASWLRGPERDLPIASWQTLRDLADEPVEVGSHGHYHDALDSLPDAAVRENLHRSRSLLQDSLGTQIKSLAYPFGYNDRNVRHAAQDVGFATAVQVGYRLHQLGSDPFAITRLLVGPNMSGNDLLARIASDRSTPAEMLRRSGREPWRYGRKLLARRRHG
jgi:peptidoglycan/xylan/chitin deacetylase (PgdA/CDA1 family)